MTKAKILCMHGYGTNATFMQKQGVSFFKTLSKQADFIFVDAPFQAPQNFVLDQKVIDLIEGQHRSWIPKIHFAYNRKQFLDQFQKIRIAFENASDHYDGILGFSQGANIIHFIFHLQNQGLINWKILQKVKFFIILSGTHMYYKTIDNSNNQLNIPSIHFVSPQDFVYSKSIIYPAQFKDPIIISHKFGHKFPKLNPQESKILINFVRKYAKNSQKKKETFQVLTLSKL